MTPESVPRLTATAAGLDWADRSTAAGYLADLVPELVCRVRDDDPNLTAAWITRRVPPAHLAAFAIILAAHVPTDRHQGDLIAWALPPVEPARWRAGHRAFVAQRGKGVPVAAIDPQIREAERAYQAASHAARVARRQGAA